ncbi:MAG: hypothetical protein M3Y65_06340 [Pseudomonadota bacterium]|nr:hypothetical protein [Pseudomonadota bacterium]
MSLYAPEPLAAQDHTISGAGRRDQNAAPLTLKELNPRLIIDNCEEEDRQVDLITFGTVREICPKCRQGGLKLVLRQSSVRVAHLFCADCASCYDATYPDGVSALTI